MGPPAPGELRRRAASGVRWTFVASAGSAIAQFGQLVVLARLLDPEDFGLIGMLLIVTGFGQAYIDLGLSAALIYRRDASANQLSSLYWLNVVAGLAVTLIVLAAVPLVDRLFDEPRLGPYLTLISLMFAIASVGRQFEVLLQRDLTFRYLGIVEAGASMVGAAIAIGLAIAGDGVWAFVAGFLAMWTVKTAALVAVGLRRWRPSLRLRWADLQGFLGFGLYQLGERTLNTAAQRVDQIVIGAFLGTRPLGFYNFAYNLISQPVGRINPIVTRVAFPVLASVQDDLGRLRRGYTDMLRLVGTVNAPVLLGLAAVAPTFVPAVFGEQWQKSVILVQVLCFLGLLRSLNNPVGSLLLARGRADLGFRWTLLTVATAIPAVIVGAELGRETGVAVALVIEQLLTQIPLYFYLIRPTCQLDGRTYALAMTRTVLYALVMALIVAALPPLLTGLSDRTTAAIQIVVGVCVYAAIMWRFERDDVRTLLSVAFGSRRSAAVQD